jgi:hypothetical protein
MKSRVGEWDQPLQLTKNGFEKEIQADLREFPVAIDLTAEIGGATEDSQ